MPFHPDSLPDLTGKVYIVTGGNTGIGYYTVAHLAQHGARVYMCARSPAKASAAIDSIKSQYPQAQITLLEMDHLSLASVASAAKKFLSLAPALHGLVNNAGIMATPFEMTKDGYEAQWQVNYLAHWVFTAHLLPLMLRTSKALPSGSVRVVNVSSSGHAGAPKGGIAFDDTSIQHGTTMARYGQAKLANILHAKTLNAQYGPASPSSKAGNGEIWTASLCPGLVDSQLLAKSELPTAWNAALKLSMVWHNISGTKTDADTGSWTSLFCAASQTMTKDQSGLYFQKASPGRQSAMAKNMTLATELEKWTLAEMQKGGWVPSTEGD